MVNIIIEKVMALPNSGLAAAPLALIPMVILTCYIIRCSIYVVTCYMILHKCCNSVHMDRQLVAPFTVFLLRFSVIMYNLKHHILMMNVRLKII